MAGIIEVKDQGKLRIYDADNSNYIDIVVPSTVSSNRTITLPDASFTVPTSDTGKVLQVVNAHTGTQVTSNSATYADTGLTAAITPSATSSKILVLVQQSVGKSGGDTKGNIRVYRGSTEIGGAVAGREIGDTDSSATNIVGTGFANSFLDTPSSTSSLTYKTQFNNNDAAGTIAVQYSSSQSYITLMEIAG